jgi:dihydrolipoamide dehydrogenase
MSTVEVKVPNIGDFKDVPVIEILVKPGDKVAKEQSLVTVESDKSTMEIPSAEDGVVQEIRVKVGDRVNEGSILVLLEVVPSGQPAPAAAANKVATPAQPSGPSAVESIPVAAPAAGQVELNTEVLVLGSGSGGYTAAFRAADLGKKVVMVERYETLGGVCLNVGCIPSKALLHAAKVITDGEDMRENGLKIGKVEIDLPELRRWKDSVVDKLTRGVAGMSKTRKVTVLQGVGRLTSTNTMAVGTAEGEQVIRFEHCVIAAGSQVARIPGFPYDDPRLMDSTGATALRDIPGTLLVIGGGIIGLEMACAYDAFGTKVTVVEFADGLIPAADRDLVKPLMARIEKRYVAVHLRTKVTKLEPTPEGLRATFESADTGPATPAPQVYDKVLLATGRRPNGKEVGAVAAGVHVDERGYIPVDDQLRTNVPNIFAIGDICGEPMLAHKATYEGKVAAEVIAGQKVAYDALTVPSVAYTDPEIAWMGLTETQARSQGKAVEVATFPWRYLGRAISINRMEGLTKVLYDPATKAILGTGIVGPNAGELIAEMTLALEMGADLEDVALTIHPHPTLSETAHLAAEIGLDVVTDLPPRRKPVPGQTSS